MDVRTRLLTLLAALALTTAGCRSTPPAAVVSVELTGDAEELRDREIVLDGLVVGRTGASGSHTLLEVAPGPHEVRILHPRLSCAPRAIVAADEAPVRVRAAVEETWRDGRPRARIVLQ